MKGDAVDPKGLIQDAYRIDGIGPSECRTIFMDWALSLPDGADTAGALDTLLARHASGAPDHPMTGVLREGQAAATRGGRRGGSRGRRQ